MYRTLVVYPQMQTQATMPFKPLLLGMDEVVNVVNLLDATLLAGQRATIHGLLDMLAEGWDVIWLITHGDENGWYLSDGLVSLSETTTLIRSSGTFLTVMNTCSSYKVAKEAADELGTAFVCTLSEVPDRQAFITGTIFAQKLASGLGYVEAYQQAKPGRSDNPYVLFEARGEMNQEPRRYGNTMPDAETLRRFIKSVEDLDLIVNGSPRLGLPALKEVIRRIETELEVIKQQLAIIHDRQRMRNLIMWGMVITICILLVTVGILVLQINGARV